MVSILPLRLLSKLLISVAVGATAGVVVGVTEVVGVGVAEVVTLAEGVNVEEIVGVGVVTIAESLMVESASVGSVVGVVFGFGCGQYLVPK